MKHTVKSDGRRRPAAARCFPRAAARLHPWLAALVGLAWLSAGAGGDAAPPPLQWSRRRWALGDATDPATARAVVPLANDTLLVATERGFIRFNGHRLISLDLGPTAAPVVQMYESSRGDLHVLTTTGEHVVWDRRTGVRRRLGSGPGQREAPGVDRRELEPTSLCEDAAGGIWVGHRDGFVKRVRGSAVAWLPPAERLSEPAVWVAADAAGGVWRIAEGQLAAWRDERFVVVTDLPPGKVAVAPARRGGLWVQAGETIFHHDHTLEPVVRFDVGSPVNLKLLEDSRGVLWIGTPGQGLSFVAPSGLTTGPDRAAPGSGPTRVGTTGGTILSLVEDRFGNVWAGTTGGLERFLPTVVWRTEMPTPAPLRAICHDGAGDLWFLTLDGRLGRERRRAAQQLPPSPSRHEAVEFPLSDATGAEIQAGTCLTAAPGGGILVGTRDQGILRCDGTTCSPLPLPDDLGGQPVTALLVTRSEALVAGVGETLAWRVGDRWLRVREAVVPATGPGPDAPGPEPAARAGTSFQPFGPIQLLAEDAAGTVWAGTADGDVITLPAPVVGADPDPPTGTAPGNRTDRDDRPRAILERPVSAATAGGITGICPLPDGAVWIAARNEGLHRWRGGRWGNVGVEQGLPAATTLGVVSDGRGRLWYASRRRMVALDVEDAEAVAAGRREVCHFWSMTGQDEASFLDPAAVPPGNVVRDPSGRVLVLLPTGIAVCQPDRLPAAAPPPPPVGIDGVKVDGHDLLALMNPWGLPADRLHRLEVPPDPRRLELRFAERTLSVLSNLRVQHRLEGIDDAWIESPPDRFISYDRLPSGRHRLRLRTSTDSVVGDSDRQGLVIEVEPRLWERTSFRLGVGGAALIAACGSTALVLRKRTRRRIDALEQLAALERERTRIARDMHDEVGTNLTQIGLLARVARSHAAPEQVATLDQMAAISRQTTAAFDEIVWAINPAHDTLPHLLSYLLQRAAETLGRFGIACHIDAPRGLAALPAPAEFRRNVLLMAKEAVGNVVKHAHARQVWITVRVLEGRLMLSIRDDGVGITDTDRDRGRSGLGNLHGRATALRGLCLVEPAAAGGTKVTVDVPLP